MEAIRVSRGIVVPAAAISLAFARSSGPGGQNVNKVASKVELHIDLDRIQGLAADARRRLAGLARRRDREGRWLVTSQKTRDQVRNLADAVAKVRTQIANACIRPRRRRATRPSASAVERRLSQKRQRAQKKRSRSSRGESD